MDQLPKVTQPAAYRIRIAGRVNDGWSDFMNDLEQSFDQENGATITTIAGIVTDQTALHGLLERIRDLNLTLLSVICNGPCTKDSDNENVEKKMKLLIAGSHGLIGSAVTHHLIESRHEVVRLVRHAPGIGEVWWNPDSGEIDSSGLEGFDAVIQLASMKWPMRWTTKAKQKLFANRMATYRLLAESLAACARKPRVLVCASGIGVYPSSGDEILTEDTAPCSGFLSEVDRAGETATAAAEATGIRVVHLRIPQVMGGPALQYVGFQAGNGQQWMSWIGRDELASIIEFVLTNEKLSGPVNAVSPNPMRNAEFATTATKALGLKPGGVMPTFIVRLVMGEMGEEFMLASRRAQPAKLLAAGYTFQFPDIESTLRHEKEILTAAAEFQPTKDLHSR